MYTVLHLVAEKGLKTRAGSSMFQLIQPSFRVRTILSQNAVDECRDDDRSRKERNPDFGSG
jgi:hypothetical protein